MSTSPRTFLLLTHSLSLDHFYTQHHPQHITMDSLLSLGKQASFLLLPSTSTASIRVTTLHLAINRPWSCARELRG